MKKFNILFALTFTSTFGFSQVLTEVTGINIFEHHFSGCSACAPSTLADSSAYDFVNHQHINAIFTDNFDPNRDLLEQNGSSSGPAPFGFTSDTNNLSGGAFGGNGTTKYVLAPGFDYANATEWSVVSAYDEANASVEVGSVQAGEVYIAKIRGLEYYVVMVITNFQSITDNDFTFDYKHTNNPITTSSVDENDLISSLSVYPNPASSEMNIQLDKTYNEVSISVVNLYGTQIISEHYTDKNLIKLNLNELSNGVYFISTNLDGNQSRIKFIKED